MLDALAVPVNLPDPVERNPAHLAGFFQKFKHPAFSFWEGDPLQRHSVDRSIPSIEIADLEPALAELPVVPNAGEQFVDRANSAIPAVPSDVQADRLCMVLRR